MDYEEMVRAEDEQYILTANKVRKLVMYCLFNEDELENGEPKDPSKILEVHGIIIHVGLHKDRVEEKKPEIKTLLEELPPEFKEGWSFLNACNDKNGRQWGEHRSMDELFSLGTAVGYVQCLMPRDLWSALPGGMPYYMVNTEPKKEQPSAV